MVSIRVAEADSASDCLGSSPLHLINIVTAALTREAERERNLVDVAFCGLKPLVDRRNGGLGSLSREATLRRFRPQFDRQRSDATLMRRIRLLSDSCEVWRTGYSFCLGLLLQYRYWFEVIGTYWIELGRSIFRVRGGRYCLRTCRYTGRSNY